MCRDLGAAFKKLRTHYFVKLDYVLLVEYCRRVTKGRRTMLEDSVMMCVAVEPFSECYCQAECVGLTSPRISFLRSLSVPLDIALLAIGSVVDMDRMPFGRKERYAFDPIRTFDKRWSLYSRIPYLSALYGMKSLERRASGTITCFAQSQETQGIQADRRK